MQTLYESKFQKIDYLKDRSLLIVSWKAETAHLTTALYHQEVQELFKYMSTLRPVLYLSDIREYQYPLSEEVQQAIADQFKDFHSAFIAIVSCTNFEIADSIDETLELLDDLTARKSQIAYFSEPNRAMDWLLSCRL